MSPDQPERAHTETLTWHRLHPRMLLLHPFRALLDLAPVVGVALLAGTDVSDLRLTLGVAVALVLLSLARWWSTTYAVLADSVEQRRGILVRRRVSVPLHRIASADVEAPLLQRLLGLRIVRLTTASSTSGQPGHGIVLNGVTPDQARRLVADLDNRTAVHVDAPPEDPVDDPGTARPASLVHWRPLWSAYAPFSAAGLVVLGSLGLVIAQFVGDIGAGGALTTAYLAIYDRVGWQGAIAVLLLGSLALSAVLAVVQYLLVNARFTIRPDDGVLRIERGLLSRRSVTLDLAKLRGSQIQATLPVRLLGGASTQAIMTGLGIVDQAATSTLAPLAPRAVGQRLADDLLGGPSPTQLPRHGAAAARRRFVRAEIGLAVIAAVVLGGWWVVAGERPGLPRWLVVTWCCLVVAAALVALDRYLQLGHRVTPQWIHVREGSLSSRTVRLSTEGVIGVVVRQSLPQRLSGVATLTFATAAGTQGYRILDLPASAVADDVRALEDPLWLEWFEPRV